MTPCPPDPPVPPDDDRLMTLEQVAVELHCSVSRAKQLEASALRKARRWLRAHGLDPEALRD